MVNSHSDTDRITIILTPNRSASWLEIKWVVLIMAAFVLTIGIVWAFVGAWMILPFAGIEIGLLAIMMYQVNVRCHGQQVITIEQQTILVEYGIRYPSYRRRLCKQTAHIEITEATTSFDLPQIVLKDQAHSIQLGEFLNQQDRQLARSMLKRAGLVEISDQWWKSAQG